MPQLGETVTEGTITRWMKSVGETIERDEPLFEVSTDKVDSEVPAPAAGVLQEILVQEGETVAVGARLAVISDGSAGAGAGAGATAGGVSPETAPGGAPAPFEPTPEKLAPASTPPPPTPPPPPLSPPLAPSPTSSPPAPPAPPQVAYAPPPAPPPPPAGYVSRPVSAGEAPAPADGAEGADGADGDGRPPGTEGMLLSPVVRRLLAENAISPAEVTGTGLGGRITREDVLALIDARRGPGAGAPAAQGQGAQAHVAQEVAPGPSAEPVSAVAASPPVPGLVAAASTQASATAAPRTETDRVVQFSNMRRRTAEHMVRSKATSPHAFIAYEVDFESVERVRKAWRERFKSEEGFSLTYLPFIARATVEALREFPNLNASVADDSLVVHDQVNLGIAVDLNHEGLIVPVVHHAEEINLRGIARRIKDLADRARNRQLSADDIAGGTFSITNDGPFGTYFTVPIINQPQVAILATDGVRRRPVVVEQSDGSESIAIHSVGVIGMSWDHRAVDGAYVSSFLRRVAQGLTARDWASEL